MPIEVIKGEATFEPAGMPLTVSDLEIILEKLKARNAELRAQQIEEVFRSDYVTVYRRTDGMEAVVAFDYSATWPWCWVAPVGDGNSHITREEAETAARESLMDADVKTEKETK